MEWVYPLLKIGVKVGLKTALNAYFPGSGIAVDLVEAGFCLYNGKVCDGVISVALGAADLKPFSVEEAIKDAMKISSKEAVVQSAKDLAKSAGKEASRKVGQDLGKQFAMGATKVGKDAAIKTAKVLAESASKEATRKVGQQVGKEIAKGVIPSAVEEVWFKGTKMTVEKFLKDTGSSFISSGGNEIKKTILADWFQMWITEMLKRKPVEMAFELTKEAAVEGAEKEFMKQSYKLFVKELNAAVLKAGISRWSQDDDPFQEPY